MANKDFLYGLSKMTLAGKTVGYIEKVSFEWGGKAPESVDVDAEQVPDAPVLTLVQKNSTVEPKFNMIQLNYENMAALLGGKSTATGWEAPTDLLQLSGECLIDTPSGKRIKIPNAVLLSNLSGKLTLTEVSKIECQLKVMKPADGTAPFSIIDIPAG